VPSALPEIDEAACAAARQVGVEPVEVLRAGTGVLYAWWPAEQVEKVRPEAWRGAVDAVRQASMRLGGTTVVEDAPAALKPHLDVWGPPTSGFHIMQRLKEQFDPSGILNPGRYVGGI
jgi:glycolate oxidase FAD binding subunit